MYFIKKQSRLSTPTGGGCGPESGGLHVNYKQLVLLVFLIMMVTALYLRLDILQNWKEYPGFFYFNGKPLLTSSDGYNYLAKSRQLLEKSESDDFSCVSSVNERESRSPPLLSVIAYYLSAISGFTLESIAVFLPPFFGLLLPLLLFFWGRKIGGNITGFTAGVFALFSPPYFSRTIPGWFDTDILNVSFALAAVILSMEFSTRKDRSRYLFLILSFLNLLFFTWWWHLPNALFLGLTPLILSVIIHYRPPRKELILFITGILLVFIGAIILAPELSLLPGEFYGKLSAYFDVGNLGLPNFEESASEMLTFPPLAVAGSITGHVIGFILGCLGFVLLCYNFRTHALYLLPLLAVGSMSFIYVRFRIYLVPLIGLGLGWLLHLYLMKRPFRRLFIPVGLLMVSVILFPLMKFALEPFPVARVWGPTVLSAFNKMEQVIPKKDLVWARWDLGYPINYLTRKNIVFSGGAGGVNSARIFNFYSYASPNERFAANLIRFYSIRGLSEIRRLLYRHNGRWDHLFEEIELVLESGPEEAKAIIESKPGLYPGSADKWIEFFYPQSDCRIFLLVEIEMAFRKWYSTGSWDWKTNKSTKPVIWPILEVKELEDRLLGLTLAGREVVIDLLKGLVITQEKETKLNGVIKASEKGEKVEYNYKRDGLGFLWVPEERYGLVVNSGIYHSMFTKLLIRKKYDPAYFRYVSGKHGMYAIYEVLGDAPAYHTQKGSTEKENPGSVSQD